MKKHFPHISSQMHEEDPFLPFSRSKTTEHPNRERSDFFEVLKIENFQNSMKIEENKS